MNAYWSALSPDDKIKAVRALVIDEALTYSQAAQRLNISRVAVAGVVDRSKSRPPGLRIDIPPERVLFARQQSARRAYTEHAKKIKPNNTKPKKVKPSKPSKLSKPKHQGFHKYVALRIPENAIDRTPAREDVWHPLPDSRPVAIEDHVNACRWPIGLDHPFRYCNEETKPGSPYCVGHSAVAFRDPPPRERTRND